MKVEIYSHISRVPFKKWRGLRSFDIHKTIWLNIIQWIFRSTPKIMILFLIHIQFAGYLAGTVAFNLSNASTEITINSSIKQTESHNEDMHVKWRIAARKICDFLCLIFAKRITWIFRLSISFFLLLGIHIRHIFSSALWFFFATTTTTHTQEMIKSHLLRSRQIIQKQFIELRWLNRLNILVTILAICYTNRAHLMGYKCWIITFPHY